MLSLTLLRSLVLGETLDKSLRSIQHQSHHHHHHDFHTETSSESSRTKRKTISSTRKTKTPLLLFMPTKELVTDTYRLATIARDLGMDLHPTLSLSHIIFSYHSSSNDSVPLTFPSFSTSSLSLLRSFVTLSKGLFKLVFVRRNPNIESDNSERGINYWDCCTLSLFSRITRNRIDTMDGFWLALAGKGWTLYKTRDKPLSDSSVYLFRKMDASMQGECRMRELRLPLLDFRNTPLRILQYILLMTDDVFYLA